MKIEDLKDECPKCGSPLTAIDLYINKDGTRAAVFYCQACTHGFDKDVTPEIQVSALRMVNGKFQREPDALFARNESNPRYIIDIEYSYYSYMRVLTSFLASGFLGVILGK